MQEQESDTASPWAELKARGRLSRAGILANRDKVKELMGDLPPPWEWRQLRESAGLAATDMEDRTGFQAQQIRDWERGFGTYTPEVWPEYAAALVKVIGEVFSSGTAPVTRSSKRRIRPVPPPEQTASGEGAAAQQRSLNSVITGLEVWFSQEDLQRFDPADAQALAATIRRVRIVLRQTETRLANIARTGTRGRNPQ